MSCTIIPCSQLQILGKHSGRFYPQAAALWHNTGMDLFEHTRAAIAANLPLPWETITRWLRANMSKIIYLAVTFIVAFFIIKIAARLATKAFDKTNLPSASLFINFLRILLWFLAVLVVLKPVFGITPSTLLTALGVGGLALSFGMKDTISNLIGGFTLMVSHVISPGDNIKVSNASGRVRDITWRHTIIKERGGNEMWIPNSVLNSTQLEKLPANNAACTTVPFVLRNGTDISMATKRILELVGRATANISLKKTNPSVRFTGFTPDGITGEIVLYAARGVGFAQITDTACRAIAGEDYIMDSGDAEGAVPVPAEDGQETIALRPVASEKAAKNAADVHPGTGIIRKEDGHVAVDNSEDARNDPYVNRILKKLVSTAESRSRKRPANPYPASGSASTESGRAPDTPGAPVADTNPQVMQQIEVNANPEKVGIIPNDAHVQVRRQGRGARGKRSSRKISSSSGRPSWKPSEAKSSSGPREAGEQEGNTAEPDKENRTDRHKN